MNEKYIQALRDAIRQSHGCASRYAETVSVKEELGGQIVWDGDVAVFDLAGHPESHQCYAWRFRDDAGKWQYVTLLKVHPIDTPLKAVQAYITTQHKNNPGNPAREP